MPQCYAMPSVHKQPGKPFWYCAFTDAEGKRRFVSTKTKNKKHAETICRAREKAAKQTAAGTFNVDRARDLITAAMEDMLLHAGQSLPTSTIDSWLTRWLKSKEVDAKPSTHSRYKLAIDDFRSFLGTTAERDLNILTATHISDYRTHALIRLTATSVNIHLRTIRACLNDAKRLGLIEKNPATLVKFAQVEQSTRRPFTAEELKKMFKVCGDSEWRGVVLCGLYTGQRFRDVAMLTWGQVDLEKREIRFFTRKTGKRLSMHIAKPLHEYLLTLESSDDASDPVFPSANRSANISASNLSGRFSYEVLAPAGLITPREKKNTSTGKGRTGKRVVNPISFHSLRHTFTSWLKRSGASEAMAMMIVGHDSPAVSRQYTHLAHEDTAAVIDKLPDLS